MPESKTSDWRELCAAAVKEQDAERVISLVDQIIAALDQSSSSIPVARVGGKSLLTQSFLISGRFAGGRFRLHGFGLAVRRAMNLLLHSGAALRGQLGKSTGLPMRTDS